MAWNGSDQSSQPAREGTRRTGASRRVSAPDAQSRHTVASSRRPYQRGLFAGLIVTAILGAAVWWFYGGRGATRPTPAPNARHNSQIAAVKPAPARTNAAPAVEEDLGWRTNRWGEVVRRKKPETYRDKFGILRYKKGNARVPNPDDFKNPIRITHENAPHEFAHPVENEIATLILAKPGDSIVGEPDYSKMKEDFVQSLMDKIEINDDDKESDKELKQNVIELKKDLAERIKNGEDLVEILKDARRELRQGAEYKRQMDELVQEQLYDPTVSDEDLKTTFEAANKMLEAKGIEPIHETRFMRVRGRMLRAQERREAAAAKAKAAEKAK